MKNLCDERYPQGTLQQRLEYSVPEHNTITSFKTSKRFANLSLRPLWFYHLFVFCNHKNINHWGITPRGGGFWRPLTLCRGFFGCLCCKDTRYWGASRKLNWRMCPFCVIQKDSWSTHGKIMACIRRVGYPRESLPYPLTGVQTNIKSCPRDLK